MYPRKLRDLHLPTRLETQRLIVRQFTPEDAGPMFAIARRNREHLRRYESHHPFYKATNLRDIQVVLGHFAWQTQESFDFGVYCRETADFVAHVQAYECDNLLPQYSIGYFVDIDHTGHGYVTEAVKALMVFAFDYLGTYRLSIDCDDTNVRSARVAERCHFVREAHIRENTLNADRTLSGRIYFGMLRREFEYLRQDDPQFQITVS